MNVSKLYPTIFAGVLLVGCADENIREVIDGLYEDKDYSGELNWPANANPSCPGWRTGEVVKVATSMTLPATCVFDRVRVEITASNVVFDCNGAVFNGIAERKRHDFGDSYAVGEEPAALAFSIQNGERSAAPLQNISLRNCQVTNYQQAVDVRLNLMPATLDGLRAGSVNEDSLRALAPTNIEIANFNIINTHSSGVYIHRYVTGFKMTNSKVKGAGGLGLYLDAGTRNAVIDGSSFEGNGFSSYNASTRAREARRSDISRREGIAIDSSMGNVIINSNFHANGDGGIYLYKNCWEYAPQELPRTDGADNNRIENNRFVNETRGIWVAERADRDLASYKCGDPLVYEIDRTKYYRDYARGNSMLRNYFEDNDMGIRIMDDSNLAQGNRFKNSKYFDIDVGSRIREIIGDPVSGTVLLNNTLSNRDGIRFQYGAD